MTFSSIAYVDLRRIREVGAELAHELEDAGIIGIPYDRKSSLEGSVGCERPRGAEGGWIAFGKKRDPPRRSRAWMASA